jgi:hypothetical protein
LKEVDIKMKKKSIIITSIIIVLVISTGALIFGFKARQKNASEAMANTYANGTEEQKKSIEQDMIKDLKAKAIETDFNKIFSGEWQGEKVFAYGVVSNLNNIESMEKDGISTFNIMATEGLDSSGLYSTINMSDNLNVKNGDKIKIYGFVDGRDSLGVSKIEVWDITVL